MNLTYKINNNYYSNKLKNIYFFEYNKYITKYLLVDKLSINIKKFNKKSLNQYLNISIINKIKKSGYFNNIQYIYLNNNKSRYFIIYFKINPILKKIHIKNYNKLQIPNNILVNIFKSQLGLPINYIFLNHSLNKISDWYKLKGYKFIKMKFNYISHKNTLNINIIEGKMFKITCIYKGQILNIKQKYIIIYLNYLIKKNLFFLSEKLFNIYQLEILILKLKKKYLLKDIKYKIENYKNKINITIKYNVLWNNNIFISKKLYFIQILKHYKLFNIDHEYLLQNIFKIYQYIYIKFFMFFIKYKIRNLNFKYNQYNYTFIKILINLLRHYIIIIFFININMNANNIDKINKFNQIIFYNKYFNNCLTIYYKYLLNTQINYENYLYFIKIFKYKTYLFSINFKTIPIIQYCTYQYYKYNKKIFLMYFYKDLLNLKTIYILKDITQKKFNLFLKYKIKLKQNYLQLVKEYYSKTQHILNIYYYLYLNLNIKNVYNILLSKYHLNNIAVIYNIFYQIPNIFDKYHILQIISELKIKINILQKLLKQKYYYISNGNIYNFNNQINIILKFEYQIYINKQNFLYTYFKYTSLNKQQLTEIQKYYYIDYYKTISIPINLSIGIQIYTPIVYLRNIKLEIQNYINNKYIIYCYI